jgi:glycosyltransferase involved in cell wall biosynthesis
MHVAHLIARANEGGPVRVIAELVRLLAERGGRSTVIIGRCEPGETDVSERLRQAGAEVLLLPGLARRIHPVDDARAAWGLLACLRRLRPDVLHTHTAKAGWLGRGAARWLGLPCVHTYHGHVLRGYFSPLGSRLVQIAERLAAGVAMHHALTRGQHRDLAQRAAIGRPGRWRVLPIPVAPVTCASAPWQQRLLPGRPVVGFLGRLTAIKDLPLWQATLQRIDRELPVQGLICGDGEERAAVAAWAATCPVPVLCTGQVPPGAALAAMDVLLLTSRNEGLPVSVIEAAGCRRMDGERGVPVVAPSVGGLNDLARAGVVRTAPRTAAGLASACLALLRQRDAAAALRRHAARYAAALEPERLADAYLALYRRAGRAQPAGPAAAPPRLPGPVPAWAAHPERS